MASEAKGNISIPVWYDGTNDEVKPLADNNGKLAVVSEFLNGYIDARMNGYIGTSWQKQPIIPGYTDRFAIASTFTVISAGTNSVSTPAVAAGYVRVLEAYHIVRNAVSGSWVSIRVTTGATYVYLQSISSIASNSVYCYSTNITMKAGDYLLATFGATTVNEILYLNIWGHDYRIDL